MISVYADTFGPSDLTYPAKSQIITFDDFYEVAAITVQLVLYNDPVFEDLGCKVYLDNSGQPGQLIGSSIITFSTGDLLFTEDYGLKVVTFEFSPLCLRKNIDYHVCLEAASYTPTSSSFIAWRNAWPDPVYRTGFTPTSNNYISAPRMIGGVLGRFLI